MLAVYSVKRLADQTKFKNNNKQRKKYITKKNNNNVEEDRNVYAFYYCRDEMTIMMR